MNDHLQEIAVNSQINDEIAEFKKLISGITYERKGILFSEMFFFWNKVRHLKPRRILESGRARGQSTLIIARCFPDTEILSIEYDANSPDVAIAAQRLSNCDNVLQLFGDATTLLPEIARSDDVVLIDGPKGHRGLRLALKLLANGRVPLVFLHDTGIGSAERNFLNQFLPESIYSDCLELTNFTHKLDEAISEELPPAHRWSANSVPPAAGYGFTLACLAHNPQRSYRLPRIMVIIDGLKQRLFFG